MRWIRSISAVALLAACVGGMARPVAGQTATTSAGTAPGAPRLIAPEPAVSPITLGTDVTSLRDALNDVRAIQPERDQAAARLVQRGTPQAMTALSRTLQAAGNRGAQLAVAKALAADPHPDPIFVDPLFALFGSDRALTDAAAQALSTYKDDAGVLERLARYATDRMQRDTRAAAIRALGTFVNKQAAEVLIRIVGDEGESDALRETAAEALVTMTGLRENDRDPRRWQQWWLANRDKPDLAWRADLVQSRAARFDRLRLQFDQLQNEVRALLLTQYQGLPPDQRQDVVLRYMRSAEPAIRAIGAHIVYDDFTNGRPIPAPVREQLRAMVSDSSADVRLEVADALKVTNDAAALDPLLVQLGLETDPDVRVEIIGALTPIVGATNDLRPVRLLVQFLHDPSRATAQAAAVALGEMGALIREHDRSLADQVSAALRDLVEQAPTGPDGAALRQAALQAMVPLRDPTMRMLYTRLLDQRAGEPPEIRRSALSALGELHDIRVADVLASSLDDPDESVRLAAVEALGKSGAPGNAAALYRRMSAVAEPSQKVRDEAWTVFQSLLADAPPEQLHQYADQFLDQPDRRVQILELLADQQRRAGQAEQLAYTEQNIGDAYMKLDRYDRAVIHLKAAFGYWAQQSSGEQGMHVEGLIKGVLDAMLRSGQYQDAVQFAAPLLSADKKNQELVGPAIRKEANRLLSDQSSEKSWRNVVDLVAQTEKMVPPLDSRYADPLRQAAEQATRKIQQRQRSPASAGPSSGGRLPGLSNPLSQQIRG